MPDNSKNNPQSHFFTRPSAFTQSASQAFGPVSTDEFRLTSKFSLSADTPAYAICKSVVLIQPQTGNAGKVNLILRPFEQPIQGVNIKYFIYRGLNQSDFFNSNQVIAATSETSDFINKINSNFAAFYTSSNPGGSVPDFLAKYIGFDPAHQADSLSLSDFFFKDSQYVESNGEFVEIGETAFELPVIELGKSLGHFAAGECGIDVVLNYGDYKLPEPNDAFVFNLAYARLPEAAVNIAGIADDFKKKQVKEQVYQFLDAAAYFGFHSTGTGWVQVDNAGTKENKKGDQVYQEVIQNFATKNSIYLYIQSDRGRSYNFYGNYLIDATSTNSLKIGDTEDSLTAKAFETQGWPLIINNETQIQTENSSKLYLQLVTDNNVDTVLYGQLASIDNAQKNNFCGIDDLQLPADTNGEFGNLTKVLTLSNPVAGPDNAKLTVANFNILLYQGITYSYVQGQVTDDQGVTSDVLAQPNYFDDVFDSINAAPLLKAGDNTEYSSVTSQKLKLINHYYDKTQNGISAVQTAIVNDVIDTGDEATPTLSRVIYITETIDILNNVVSVSGTITPDTKSSPSLSGSVTGNKTYKLPEPFYYDLSTFTDSTETITGLELKATDGSIPTKIILGITKAENDLLKGLITDNGFTNPMLFLIDLFEDGTELVSTENITYQKYKLGIAGETVAGELKFVQPAMDINVFSLDRKYHFSQEYSKYVKEDPILSLSLDLEIAL